MKERKKLSSQSQSSSQLSLTSSFRKSRRKNESGFYGGSSISSTASTISSGPGIPGEKSESLCNETPNLLTRFLKGYKRRLLITLIIPGILVGLTYFYSISHHFHSITNFSSLTSLEKELSLPVQSSIRYSVFKRIAQEESLIEGIRSVLPKNGENLASGKDSMSSELVLGTAFHLLQKLLQDFTSINSSQACRTWREGEEGPEEGSKHDWKCLSDPLTFYITAYWVIESLFVAFLYINSSILSESCLGGLLSTLTFTLNHPQAARMGVSVGVMILAWEKEAQWILCTQLLVTLLIHFVNGLSPYRTSIVVASHIVGWEYATFARLDTTFPHWSFYGYLLLASLLCMFIMEPIVDKCFGDKIDKWMFLRAIMLTLAFHICFTHIRLRVGPVIQEDPRMSLVMGGFKGHDLNETWTAQSTPGGVIAQERDFGSAAPWLKAIGEPRRAKGNDLWTRGTSYDYWHRDSLDLGGRQRRLPTTGNRMSGGSVRERKEPPVIAVNDEGRAGNVNLESIGSLMQEEEEYTDTEGIHGKEGELLISTRQLNDVLYRLRLCNQSKSIIPVSRLFQENFCVFSLTFFTVICSAFSWYRERGCLVKGRHEERESTGRSEPQLKRTTQTYLLLCVAFLVFLTSRIHHKFHFLLLIQMSVVIGDIPNHKNYSWIARRVFPGKEKQCHFLLFTILVSVMLGMGKLRVDDAHIHPQKSDPGLGESLELVNWWKSESSDSFSSEAVVFGPRDSISKLQPSTNASFFTWRSPGYEISKWSSEKKIFTMLSHLLCKKETSTPKSLHESLSLLNVTHLLLTPETCSDSSLMFIMPPGESVYRMRPIDPPNDDEERRFHRENKPSLGNKRGIRSSSRSVLVNSDKDDETIIPTIKPEDSTCVVKNRLCDELEIQKGDSLCSRLLAHRDRNYEDSIKPFHRLFYNRLYTILEL